MAHRFTRAEYAHMPTAGLFGDKRVELLDGEIITMSPKLSSHTSALNRLMYTVIVALGSTALVRVQDPIILNDWSEPEPDLAVCQPDPDYYKHTHPKPDQILLVIEVADSSLAYDRTRKAQAYAGSGIPEYWIVNLPDGQIEILTEPIIALYNTGGAISIFCIQPGLPQVGGLHHMRICRHNTHVFSSFF